MKLYLFFQSYCALIVPQLASNGRQRKISLPLDQVQDLYQSAISKQIMIGGSLNTSRNQLNPQSLQLTGIQTIAYLQQAQVDSRFAYIQDM